MTSNETRQNYTVTDIPFIVTAEWLRDHSGQKNIKIFETHTIPLLDEALSSWPEINFNIEPKSLESAHLLKDQLKSMKNIDRICIGSFSNTKIDILRNRSQICRRS